MVVGSQQLITPVDTHCVSMCYDHAMKDAGIRIRVERELRDAFLFACQSEERQASDVLREFMRVFADRHQGTGQGNLFSGQRKPRGRGNNG